MSPLAMLTRRAGGFLLAAMIGCSSVDRSSTLAPSDAETPYRSGPLSGSLIGPLGPPITTTGSGATVNGLVGRFTSLVFDPGSSTDPLGATPLFYSVVHPNYEQHIWRINLDGTQARQITFGPRGQFFPGVDPVSGRVAFFRDAGGDTLFVSVWSMDQDGGDQVQILAGSIPCIGRRLEWAPSGNVLYNDLCGDPFLREITFGPILRAEGFSVVNSSAGKFVLVARQTIRSDTPGGIYKVTYPGREISTVLRGDTNNVFAEPEASRTDPVRLAYWRWTAPDTVWKLHVGLLSDPSNTRVIQTLSRALRYSDLPCLRWAPDGNHLIMTQFDYSYGSQLVLVDTLGTVVRQISFQPYGAGCPSVGVPDSAGESEAVALIGDGGLLGTSASGVIVSQGAAASLTALVAFRAGSQRSVQLETGTGLNSTASALTYTLKADRLTALAYTGFPGADSAVQVIDSTAATRATGALITFDAASGSVALILPFTTSNSSQPPQVSDGEGIRTFQGSFLAAYDRRGRNLAPNGATAAVLDLKTGVARVNR